MSRCPCESVQAKCWPSIENLQSNTAPWPWPSIWETEKLREISNLAFSDDQRSSLVPFVTNHFKIKEVASSDHILISEQQFYLTRLCKRHTLLHISIKKKKKGSSDKAAFKCCPCKQTTLQMCEINSMCTSCEHYVTISYENFSLTMLKKFRILTPLLRSQM